MHAIEITSEPAVAGDRNTVGGWPILESKQSWPDCSCGKRMVLFFQLDVPDDIADFGGEHLLVFQCPVHNEACFGPAQLPELYWEKPTSDYEMAHWRILRHRGGVVVESADAFLQPRRLLLRDAGPDDKWAFRVGGKPAWIQDAEVYTCACGAGLEFLAQIPENLGFPKRPEVPEQDGAFSEDEYGLLLGNMTYLLACPNHCDPAAAWPVNQH
ncbi:hypothetical protein KZ829_06375 [Actinoplanes hulinensis]|uniref:Uncharacterized protein n=1 Tax=Actinoplanes hulinensis TaxID=1144547 RepID=A0ABS7AXB5_9ACTN|nr:hypothetical protein [Actinoplanes hulinensis]MBW6433370.1 hypothetical protein [Actinoplanes hulinensis]